MRRLTMNFMVCMFALCMAAVSVADSVNYGEANQRKKVILDTDTGTGIVGEEVDDGLALLLALASPELDLIGVTEVHGNVNVDQGVANALLILELVGRDDIPVYKGAGRPLVHKWVRPGGIKEPYGGFSKLKASSMDATDFIIEKVMENPGQITLICVGPLTNIAMALRKEPQIIPNVKELIIMGGAIDRPGNITSTAEFNFWVDPEAAKIVLRSGIRNVTLVPLDATTGTLLTKEQLKKLKSNPVTEWLKVVVPPWIDRIKKEGCHLHDPLAVAVAINRNLVETETMWVDVIDRSGSSYGQSVGYRKSPVDRKVTRIEVALRLDTERFMNMFLTRLGKYQ
ncbi:Pyrimidine-specific ribonucleoside hydrolase RihB [subsurface metagenome]